MNDKTREELDIINNKYDVDIIDEEIKPNKHRVQIHTFVNGEEYTKWFSFSHDQIERDSWTKHIKLWIDKIEKQPADQEFVKRQGSVADADQHLSGKDKVENRKAERGE